MYLAQECVCVSVSDVCVCVATTSSVDLAGLSVARGPLRQRTTTWTQHAGTHIRAIL